MAKKLIYLQQEYPDEYFGAKYKKLMNLLDKMVEKKKIYESKLIAH